jgi:general secretion pathway protein B
MSFILDALQRAEAERARGGVPTLQTRPLSGTAETPALATPQRLGWAAAGLAVILVAAALGWWIWGSTPPSPPSAVVSVPANVPPATPAPAATAAPVAIAPAVLATPALVTPTVAPVQPPTVAPATPASAPVQSVAPPPQPATAASVAASSAPKPQVPAAPSSLPPLLSALPEEIRRQIPPLSISGLVYSADPALRLLLVNGQVLKEGSQVAQDLTLVEIRATSSEFDFQGTRFRIAR